MEPRQSINCINESKHTVEVVVESQNLETANKERKRALDTEKMGRLHFHCFQLKLNNESIGRERKRERESFSVKHTATLMDTDLDAPPSQHHCHSPSPSPSLLPVFLSLFLPPLSSRQHLLSHRQAVVIIIILHGSVFLKFTQ